MSAKQVIPVAPAVHPAASPQEAVKVVEVVLRFYLVLKWNHQARKPDNSPALKYGQPM
jgi:hypothetical protein